jgi:2-polyprenyl-3-methyl-5-hydroxy-6-metoxy-1,4-benzoquinol methylase
MMRCSSCRQQFVSPRSHGFDDLYNTREYFSGMNHTNRVAARFRQVWFAARYRMIATALGRMPNTVVEIGPSWGEFVAYSRARGVRMAVSEFSAQAAEVVRQAYDIPVQIGPFDPAFFVEHGFDAVDCVCMWDVVEHVPDPAVFVRSIAEIVPRGAAVAFSCPDAGSALARSMGSKWHTFKPDEHLWHFEHSTITRLFAEQGFEVTWLSSNPLRPVHLLRFDCMSGVAVRR